LDNIDAGSCPEMYVEAVVMVVLVVWAVDMEGFL
jgi:hypothetical protein